MFLNDISVIFKTIFVKIKNFNKNLRFDNLTTEFYLNLISEIIIFSVFLRKLSKLGLKFFQTSKFKY